MKVGLVLEGGAMRGLYTAAILDLFLENNTRSFSEMLSFVFFKAPKSLPKNPINYLFDYKVALLFDKNDVDASSSRRGSIFDRSVQVRT